MKTRAGVPSSRAAHATAWAWFPALAATTPAARSASPSNASLLTAPRILNEPVRWRFSAFSQILRPVRRDRVSEPYTGVTRACAAMRPRASSMSASVGAALTWLNPEHLLEDLTNRRQRVELAALHLVEQPAQLGLVSNGGFDVPARTNRSDGEHLLSEIAPA